MKEQDTARYCDRDDSPVIDETSRAAINYIFGGNQLDVICELRGLPVFAVISALRENDEALHGDEADLSEEQSKRLCDVEGEVTKAVGMGMHYYPWGDNRNKTNIDPVDRTMMTGGVNSHFGQQASGRANNRSIRRRAIDSQRTAGQSKANLPREVVVKKITTDS